MASRKKVQNTHIGKQIRHLHGSLLDIVSLINRPQLDEVLIQEAARELATGAPVYDVRSHGYFDPKATRIQGSRRLDPNALHQSGAEMPEAGKVFVYCTCVRQATSAKVARELQKMLLGKNVRVTVIQGGLSAWVKAGLPVEDVPPEEVANLPVFE